MFIPQFSLSKTSFVSAISKLCCLSLLLFSLAAVQAQDEFSIPGVEDNASAGSSSSGEVVVTEYSNLLEEVIGKGGWAIWILLFFSLVVVGLTVFCFIDLAKSRFYPDRILKPLQEDMEHGDVMGALERAKGNNTCIGQVMYGATEYIGDRGYQVLDDGALYDAMADASQEFNRGRARTINYFSVIAQAAPMVGLLGTVSGMIKAFAHLSDSGMQPGLLANDISEALYTTATGLVIAVPTLFLYFFFRDRLTHLIAVTDRHAYRMLNSLRRAIVAQQSRGGDPGGSAPPPQQPQPTPDPQPAAPDDAPAPYVPTPHTRSTPPSA